MLATCYLHSNKESNGELGKKLGLKGAALDLFLYSLYEVKIILDVNPQNGHSEIIAVDGRRLEPRASS